MEQPGVQGVKPLAELCPKVGIVGGTHGTGAQFAKLLARRGFDVRVSGRTTPVSNAQLAKESDLLIFAPPLKCCVEVIEATIVHCERADQLVVDLCSLKEAPMEAMGKAPGQHIGLHPLFGPSFEDLRGQDLVICPGPEGSSDERYGALHQELAAMGLALHEMNAAQHDRLMATIQVIPHLGALINGALFRSLGIDAAESLKICSPVYKTELYMIGRIHSQNPALYASIIAKNPHSTQIARTLSEIVGELKSLIGSGNLPALEAAFSANKEHLGGFADDALRESQKLLQAYNQEKTR